MARGDEPPVVRVSPGAEQLTLGVASYRCHVRRVLPHFNLIASQNVRASADALRSTKTRSDLECHGMTSTVFTCGAGQV